MTETHRRPRRAALAPKRKLLQKRVLSSARLMRRLIGLFPMLLVESTRKLLQKTMSLLASLIKRLTRRLPMLSVDVVGVVGVLVAALCLAYEPWMPGPRPEYVEFCLNLSVEVIGIWIAVRAIDTILKARDRRHGLRLDLVRNVRFLSGLVHRTGEYVDRMDIYHLQREYDWAVKITAKRQRYLADDEARDLKDFHDLVERILAVASELREIKEKMSGQDDADFSEFERRRAELKEEIRAVDDLAKRAEANILKETEEA